MSILFVLAGIFGYATQVLGIVMQMAAPWKQLVKAKHTFKNAFKALGYVFWGLGIVAGGGLFVDWAGVIIPDVFWLTIFILLKWLVFLIGLTFTVVCFIQAAKVRQQRA